jgi:hypothetical protein
MARRREKIMDRMKNTWIDRMIMGGIVLTAVALAIYVVSICLT